MTTMTPVAEITPEELLALPDNVQYELVDGKLVEREMGMESSGIGTTIIGIIFSYLSSKGLGQLFGADASYQCFADAPSKVRRADVSFIRFGRLPGDVRPKGNCPIPPDLAVEVISPNESFYGVEDKVEEYLSAGVQLVWVVSPPTRKVHIYRPHSSSLGSGTVLTDTDTITGEDVVPGFSCPVRDFFA